MRLIHQNKVNQTFQAVTGELEGEATRPKMRGAGKKSTALKLSAAATRALVVLVPAKERDAVAAVANELAAQDDREIRGMVWDVHIFAALGMATQVRPGVIEDDAARAIRQAHSLKASTKSPRAKA